MLVILGRTQVLRLTFSIIFHLFVFFFMFLDFYSLFFVLPPYSCLFILIESILICGVIEVKCQPTPNLLIHVDVCINGQKNNHQLRFTDASFLHNILTRFSDKYDGTKRIRLAPELEQKLLAS